MLLVGFLTRRAIENRKRTDSIPTLSEYQSSTIEKSLSHMSNYHPTYHPLPQAHSPHIVPVINTGHLVTIGPDGHYSHQGNSHYGHNKDFVVLPDMNRFVKVSLAWVIIDSSFYKFSESAESSRTLEWNSKIGEFGISLHWRRKNGFKPRKWKFCRFIKS